MSALVMAIVSFWAGCFVGYCLSARDARIVRRDNVVRIDAGRRYEMAKNGDL